MWGKLRIFGIQTNYCGFAALLMRYMQAFILLFLLTAPCVGIAQRDSTVASVTEVPVKYLAQVKRQGR
jgi:hypothetical protein